ncbi:MULTISPECIES: M56 family metallopeptidase [unclassified Carboxylicivirga]|uniref:M56 family metallopeptidase n=1 Tax=Carboxylicivirga TaxID=1628153 RepID=UPI003D32CC8C
MDLLTYFTRSSLILFIFLAIYKVFLRNDAHYAAIRYFLLLGLGAALCLPFAELNYTVLVEQAMTNQGYEAVEIAQSEVELVEAELPDRINWLTLLAYLYAGLTIIFLVRIMVMLVKMLFFVKNSRRVKCEGVTVCINADVEMPFVFGNWIFIKDEQYLSSAHAEIMTHERVHLFQQHWIDVMLSELFIALHWFNPLAWHYARLIKQNLEFLADQGVLKKGHKYENYVQIIICETMGAEVSVLANHFRFSQNKRRLKMMKNDKKSKWRLLKLLLVLPMMGGLLWAFSEPVYEYRSNNELKKDTSVRDEGKKFLVKGIVGIPVSDTVVVSNVQTNVSEMKVISGISPLPGTSILIKGTTTGTVANMQGEFELPVSVGDELVFSFVGFETRIVKVNNQKLLTVAMVQTGYELDPSEIKARLKGESVIEPNTKDGKPVFFIVEEMPSFNEGEETFADKLQKKVHAVKQKEELNGKVKVQFIVTEDGQLKDIKAINRVNEIEAKYAVQIISELNDWKPGKQRGKPVSTTLVVPVEFD